MAVVPPEFLLTHHFQKPDVRVEEDMFKLLDESKLPDDMKAKLLGEMVSRFQHEVHKPKEPIRVSLSEENNVEKKAPDSEEEKSAIEKHLQPILLSIPKSSWPYAKLTINKLKNNNYAWNDDWEFMKGHNVYEDTNIIDLFSYLMRNTKENPPYGFYEFVEALSDSRIPLRWIGNSSVKKNWFPFAKKRKDSPIKSASSTKDLSIEENYRGSTSKEWESY